MRTFTPPGPDLDFLAGIYDPECERLDVAIRAIWLLYRRGRWELLGRVGLDRASVELPFETFDYDRLTNERGRLRTEGDCYELIRYAPLVLHAALQMMKLYQAVTSRSRGAYYGQIQHLQELFGVA
jgi:hypothetical protein